MSRVKDQLRRERHQHAEEIERLREGRRRAAQILIEKIGAPGPESIEVTAERAAKRIEELETKLNPPIPYIRCEGGGDPSETLIHIITTDQIRAAWRWWATSGNDDVRRALENFNIVRCEGCDGGSVTKLKLEKDNRYKTINCHDCNGEGWVKE